MIHEKASFIPDEALWGDNLTTPGIATIWFAPEKVGLFFVALIPCFKPRVIFVGVVLHDPLKDLATRLQNTLRPLIGEENIDTRPYHPHMTVAFKDLKPYWFYRAWEYFSAQSYQRTFTADALCLLKHNGKEWEVIINFEF